MNVRNVDIANIKTYFDYVAYQSYAISCIHIHSILVKRKAKAFGTE